MSKIPVADDNRLPESAEQRRRAVNKILLGGGALSGAAVAWQKPVIESVLLPAHAQTTGIRHGDGLEDPVSLSYVCGGTSDWDYVVSIEGYINQPVAGVRVRLRLTWDNENGDGHGALTKTPPIEVEVFTAADGTYESNGHNIGYNVVNIQVEATLPEYPEALEATDELVRIPYVAGSYYCAPLET